MFLSRILLLETFFSLFSILFLPLGTFFRFLYIFLRSQKWNAKDKVIVITGASSGIGQALAEKYAQDGAYLALCARRKDQLEKVSQKCKQLGAKDVFIGIVDVGSEEDCKQFAHKVQEKFKVVDCLVLNAGISMGENFDEISDLSIYDQLMRTNYFGCVYCTSYFLPSLKRSSNGRMVVISSIAGIHGIPTRTGYSASKFALDGFFEALRIELKKFNIGITMIYPGVVQTDINRTRLGSNKHVLDVSKGMPVDVAASRIHEAVQSGMREAPLLPLGYLLSRWQAYFPELMDFLIAKEASSMQSKEKKQQQFHS